MNRITEADVERVWQSLFPEINAIGRPPTNNTIVAQHELIREVLEEYVKTGIYPTFCGGFQDYVDEYNKHL